MAGPGPLRALEETKVICELKIIQMHKKYICTEMYLALGKQPHYFTFYRDNAAQSKGEL